ncbi:MAG: hypothetical protein JXX28_01635 [Deltaproteobacteria bacterium]|nr:hypothetical protein [Deltaproteobacteria bacterium]
MRPKTLEPAARVRLRGLWVSVALLTAMLVASAAALGWQTWARAEAEWAAPPASGAPAR